MERPLERVPVCKSHLNSRHFLKDLSEKVSEDRIQVPKLGFVEANPRTIRDGPRDGCAYRRLADCDLHLGGDRIGMCELLIPQIKEVIMELSLGRSEIPQEQI